MNIQDFFPKYPNIKKYKDNYLNPYEDNFYESIFKKKEFYEKRLSETEEPISQELLNHQQIISRFLSSNTLYNSLLLLHDPGTGKSCSAIGTIEKIRKENSSIKGALVLTRGENLLNKFKDEIVYVCAGGRYLPDEDQTENARIRQINKNLSEFYQFETFETFAKKIDRFPSDHIKKEYSNKIIVIDEIQNIRIKPKKKNTNINVYNSIHRFLHLLKNKKVLLLSATPMKDRPEEIAGVMNLILPTDKQIPTGNEFISEFFDIKDNKIKDDKKKILKKFFKGYVSYLNFPISTIPKKFITNNPKYPIKSKLKEFKVYFDEMSEIQNINYLKAFEKDNREEEKINNKDDQKLGLYNDSIQSSLFVFPDGSYGKKAFEGYEINTKDKKGKKIVNNKLDLIYKKIIGDKSNKLKKLSNFSQKYSNTIKNILDSNNKSCFVYCNKVEGSGLILFSKILNLFGFSPATANNMTHGLRYGLLTGTAKNQENIIKVFNSPENAEGKIIKVILGSRKTSEGFTFKNIQIIHILTPHWNYAEPYQAIARGIRIFSHEDILKINKNTSIDIFQHVSVPITNEKGILSKSIDYKMYKTSEKKDIGIKSIERLLKESSFDCGLFFLRNKRIGFNDFSRECEYQLCKYKCDGIPDKYMEPDPLSPKEIDISTYQLYYSKERQEEIIEIIKKIFRTTFMITFVDLQERLENFLEFDKLTTLNKMIEESIPIYNKFGIISYLREKNNLLFLVDKVSIKSDFLSKYYTKNISIVEKNNFESISKIYYIKYLTNILKKLKKIPGGQKGGCGEENEKGEQIDKRDKFLSKLPLYLQEFILENAIIVKESRKNYNKKFVDWILKFYENDITKIGNFNISKLLGKSKIRCFSNNEWEYCSEDIMKKINQEKEYEEKRFEKNKLGFYGIITKGKTKDTFRLRDVSNTCKVTNENKAKRSRGKTCVQSWTLPELYEVINTIKLDFPEDFKSSISKKDLISQSQKEYNKRLLKLKAFNKLVSSEGTTTKDIRRLLYYLGNNRNVICKALYDFLDNKNLIQKEN